MTCQYWKSIGKIDGRKERQSLSSDRKQQKKKTRRFFFFLRLDKFQDRSFDPFLNSNHRSDNHAEKKKKNNNHCLINYSPHILKFTKCSFYSMECCFNIHYCSYWLKDEKYINDSTKDLIISKYLITDSISYYTV